MDNRFPDTFPVLTTERLLIREIKQEDAPYIFQILSNPDVIQYDTFEPFTQVRQAENLIRCFQQDFEKKRAIFWGIALTDSPECIGFCKCEIEVPKVRADIGYDLSPAYWNKGIMTEALQAVMEYTFHALEVNRLEATASTENKASIRVLEKLGFHQEGILRQRSILNGRLHDMAMLSILRQEYLQSQGEK